MLMVRTEKKTYFLGLWDEATDVIDGIYENTIVFKTFQVRLPESEIEKIRNYLDIIGSRVSILRTNIPGKEYLFRKYKAQNSEKGQLPSAARCYNARSMWSMNLGITSHIAEKNRFSETYHNIFESNQKHVTNNPRLTQGRLSIAP